MKNRAKKEVLLCDQFTKRSDEAINYKIELEYKKLCKNPAVAPQGALIEVIDK
jgi:hypothetical protein